MVLFKVMFLCGVLSQRCSVDGPLPRYVFVSSISLEVFCRWSSFKVMFLCGELAQKGSIDGPSQLCFCVEH